MHPQEMTKLFEMIDALTSKVEQLQRQVKPSVSRQSRSENIDQLAAAFASAQAEYPQIGFNRANPFFKSKYSDLDAIMYSIRPILGKHGLSFYCETDTTNDERHIIYAQLLHKSGQWISSTTRIVPESQDKNYNQAYAKSLSYLKRHQAMALLNVTCTDDPVDNDNSYDFPDPVPMNKLSATPHMPASSNNPHDSITVEQWQQLTDLLDGYPDIATGIMQKMNLKSLRDFPKSEFNAAIKRINQLIQQYNGANK